MEAQSVNVDSAPQPGPASNKAAYYDARSQRLELSEMPEGLAAALAVFDLDNDGFVDADELGRGALAFSKAKVKVCGTQPRSRARVRPRWEAARDSGTPSGIAVFLPTRAVRRNERASRQRCVNRRRCCAVSRVISQTRTGRLTLYVCSQIKRLTRLAFFIGFLLCMQLGATCA